MTSPQAVSTSPAERDLRAVPSKSLATWIAVVGGSLGLHHFYLHGWRNAWGWLYPIPTLVGLAGVIRMRNLGVEPAFFRLED